MTAIELIKRAIENCGSTDSRSIKGELGKSGDLVLFTEMASEKYGNRAFGELYYLVVNDTNPKVCGVTSNELKFVSPSVGYRFCGPASKCECARHAVSSKVRDSKSRYSDETRERIGRQRAETNREKFGSDNVFSSSYGKEKIRETNLVRYGVENPQQNDVVREKTKATARELYGVENPAKSSWIRGKIKATNLERYGKENALANDDIKAKAASTMCSRYGSENPAHVPMLVEKRKQTNLERHGSPNPLTDPNRREEVRRSQINAYLDSISDRVNGLVKPLFTADHYKSNKQYLDWQCVACSNVFSDRLINGRIPVCRVCNPLTISTGHKAICDQLESWGIEYEINNRAVISPKELDIWIPSHKLAIEYCGVYWHSELSGGKLRNYHLEKLQGCEDLGIRLLTVFDDELLSSKDRVFSRIRSLMKLDHPDQVTPARKCQVRRIDSKLSDAFANTHHLMGTARASVHYGLFCADDLVSVMTFSPSRFDRTGYELVRYCSSKVVIGGARRLFSRFIKEHPNGNIVSYADRRWSNGGVYYQLGFKLDSISPPGYWYVDGAGGRLHRLNFTKKKLVAEGYDRSKSEWEIMQERGYDRIWDCGQLVFRYIRQ